MAINTATIGLQRRVGHRRRAGRVARTVSFVSFNAANPTNVIATYQFTAPGGSWATTGQRRLQPVRHTMNPNQVSDANGYVPAGPIGTFAVAIPRTFTVNDITDTDGTAGPAACGTGHLRTAQPADASGAHRT